MWDTINTLDDYWWPIYWVNPKMCIVIASRNMKAWVDYSDIVLGNMELDDKHKALKEIKYTMYSGHDENLCNYKINIVTPPPPSYYNNT